MVPGVIVVCINRLFCVVLAAVILQGTALQVCAQQSTVVASESCDDPATCDSNGTMMYKAGIFGRVSSWWSFKAKPGLQAGHWGYADQFCERPHGSYARYYMQTQTWNGLADSLVLYRYDFEGLRAIDLSPRGRYQLKKIATAAIPAGLPIVIQPSGISNTLDQKRQEQVLLQLQQLGFAPDAAVVQIAHPQAPGLDGPEAQAIWNNQLGQTTSQGNGTGSSSNSGTSGSLGNTGGIGIPSGTGGGF